MTLQRIPCNVVIVDEETTTMQIEFFTARTFTTADPANIRRLRWVPGDGAHGDPVACAVLLDGTVGRFLDSDTLIDYLQR